ncbi:MAG: hypothetical protein HW387_1732 [Parachlamydiales bacterium]|nr:hypothetical protein [Parachlamydiales bacterium]
MPPINPFFSGPRIHTFKDLQENEKDKKIQQLQNDKERLVGCLETIQHSIREGSAIHTQTCSEISHDLACINKEVVAMGQLSAKTHQILQENQSQPLSMVFAKIVAIISVPCLAAFAFDALKKKACLLA